MRRFWLAAVFGLVASLLLAGAVRNGGQSQAVFQVQSAFFDNPIEQQTPCDPDGTHCGSQQQNHALWVLNVPNPYPDVATQFGPVTNCAWDPDDNQYGAFLASSLNPGQTITGYLCYIGDDSPHLTFLRITTPGLAGTLTVGSYLTLNVNAGQAGCIMGPQFQHPTSLSPSVYSDPRVAPIPGSNGGAGEWERVTVTLTNTSAHKIRSIVEWAKVATRIDENSAPCPFPMFSGTPLYPIGNYPQVWWWVG